MDIDNRSVRSGNYHTLTIVTPVAQGKEPTDYNVLDNKPSINGVELIGDRSLAELGIPSFADVPTETLTEEQLEEIVNDY